MKKIIHRSAVLLLIASGIFLSCSSNNNSGTISLSGTWKFQKDTSDVGVSEEWFTKELNDAIELPGSMMQRDKGSDLTLQTQWTGSIYDSSYYYAPQYEEFRQTENLKFPFWLTPPKHYVGPAWYQKTIEIPEEWKGRQVNLHLERPHWETIVWIDDHEVGMQNSLSTPHEYDLTQWLTPGSHTLTIRVDNRIKEINPGANAHSLTDHTQGNWNGIVGDIKMEARSPVYIADVEVFPNVTSKTARVIVQVNNITGKAVSGKIRLRAESFNTSAKHQVDAKTRSFQTDSSVTQVEIEYPMGENVQLWDEFNPALYKLKVVLTDKGENEDIRKVQFGMREFTTEGTRFAVNGTPVFLRGTLDNAAFPLTGYPPTEVESWENIFNTIKEHGLNHVRFHSWCPPEAAFIAADKVGIYLQPEAASWPNNKSSVGDGQPIDQYIFKETKDIIDTYGNHPSFTMMAAGNEPAGSNQVEYLNNYLSHWKEQDNRRVYTGASIAMSWPLVPNNEFLVRSGPRGLNWRSQPGTETDFSAAIKDTDIPYIAHESGQYVAYPNFKEIDKYTGVYKAKNFELFRSLLQKNNMERMGDKFLMASGKLQALAYKAEIEKALRTPGLAGFQLLGLSDFPGQGTALVGVLDAFWEEKGYITPGEFRRFSGHSIPLARIPKFVFENSESFHADVEVAHFGPESLSGVKPVWRITDGTGKEIATGTFATADIPIGNGFKLGEVDLPLPDIRNASRLNLEVKIGEDANDWNFWVFPADSSPMDFDEIYVADSLDAQAEKILKLGGKVFIDASGKIEYGKEVVQYFRPVFWNTAWFKMRPPHTTGIYLDSTHPAFDDFPTSFHSDYQWWDIVNRQQVMRLKDFPPDFKPLVQPIDTYHLNRKLGLILEAKTGGGRLIITSADLTNNLDERPAARQLRNSLLQYMKSEKFDPEYNVELSVIRDLFTKESELVNFYTNESTDDLRPETDK